MRVLIVEDVAETRRWLIKIVSATFPAAQIAHAATLRIARGLLHQPFDLALIDLGLPDGTGLDLLHQLRETDAQTMCVVTTVMGDDASIVAALSAGAVGYILKENPPELIERQLSMINSGFPALSPSIARRLMTHFSLTGPSHTPELRLTKRETEVLALIARGLRNTDVADTLGITPTTVASYIKSIYRKLGISSRAEASWHATRMGLSDRDQTP